MGKIHSNKSNSNTKKNRPRNESFRLWMDSHKLLGFFLVFGLILGIGLGVTLVLNSFLFRCPTEISTIVFQYI